MRYETSTQSIWGRVPRQLRAVPSDLSLVLGLLLIANVVFYIPWLRTLSIAGARVWTLVALPLLGLAPGYVLVSILFPGRADGAEPRNRGETVRDPRPIESIDLLERAALAFGMSVTLLPVFGVAVGTAWGFSPSVVMPALTVLLLAGSGLALVQRFRLPAAERFDLPVGRWSEAVRQPVRRSDATGERAATVALAFAILLTAGAVGYAVATPYQSGSSATLYLVTENETGTQLAADYPTDFTAGQPESLTVGIKNDEERQQEYTIVVTVERVDETGATPTVTAARELDRLSATVPAGDNWTERHTVAPELRGENLRLHYALYRDGRPSNTAYRDAYLWIDVSR